MGPASSEIGLQGDVADPAESAPEEGSGEREKKIAQDSIDDLGETTDGKQPPQHVAREDEGRDDGGATTIAASETEMAKADENDRDDHCEETIGDDGVQDSFVC